MNEINAFNTTFNYIVRGTWGISSEWTPGFICEGKRRTYLLRLLLDLVYLMFSLCQLISSRTILNKGTALMATNWSIPPSWEWSRAYPYEGIICTKFHLSISRLMNQGVTFPFFLCWPRHPSTLPHTLSIREVRYMHYDPP